jgi:hypothetical protein
MVDEATHLRSVAKFVPAIAGSSHHRTYWRQRNDLVRAAARHIHRIQKALTQMNIRFGQCVERRKRNDRAGHRSTAAAFLAGTVDCHASSASKHPIVWLAVPGLGCFGLSLCL